MPTVRAIGTHLDPQCLFARFDIEDIARDAIVMPGEIAARVSLATEPPNQVVVTRSAGLFVEYLSEPSAETAARLALQREAVERINLVICELTLLGISSQPASSAELARAEVHESSVSLVATAGYFKERTFPASSLTTSMQRDEFLYQVNESVLREADGVSRALACARVSPTLPRFIAAAYAFYSRWLVAESLNNAWIAIEQIVNHRWGEHVKALDPSARQRRLRDYRTFTAAVQIEVLETVGQIEHELALQLHEARRARNDLAHSGKVSDNGCRAAMIALRELVADVTGTQVVFASQMQEEIPW